MLVHGTVENAYDNWAELSPQLKADGYCVFALNYGGAPERPLQAVGDIAASAGELSAYVDRVLAATGAAKVDIVGHSQGGMMPRYYLKFLGGARKVDHLIALSPTNYGTTFNGVLPLIHSLPAGDNVLGSFCEACVQQREGSAFLQNTLQLRAPRRTRGLRVADRRRRSRVRCRIRATAHRGVAMHALRK